MFLRKPLLLLLFLFCCAKGFAATFVVTSNADSGPGTLRDALAQANSNNQKNAVYFNFADNSVAGRTITLLSFLPVISNSIVIDGTTQPGKAFGLTDAKIRIVSSFTYPAGGLHGILEAHYCSDIEVYGIWITSTIDNGYLASIYVSKCDSVHVGAALKGNLIEREGPTLDSGKTCFFQHNICFSDTLGERPGAGLMNISSYDNITIGGSADNGNMIAGGLLMNLSNPAGNTLEISYNKMGTDITGTQAPYGFNLMAWPRIWISPSYSSSTGQALYTPLYATIKNNIIADVYDEYLLIASDFAGKIVIQGNGFNTDLTGTLNFNQYSQGGTVYAIDCLGDADVLVGGDDPSEKNLIAYCGGGIEYDNIHKFTISKNSMFCNGETSSIDSTLGTRKIPHVSINQVAPNQISGTATPLSKVELFSGDCSCTTMPGPKTYFATVNADANGNWSYSGVNAGYLMASATLDSLTSLFSGVNVNDSAVKITNYSCGTMGAITGIINPYTSSTVSWYNSTGKLIGNTIDLTNVPADTYTLKIEYGGNCAITKTYTIQDYSIHIDPQWIGVTQPSCGLSNGGVVNPYVYSNAPFPLTCTWTDESGKVWSTTPYMYNVPAGAYTLHVSRTIDTCTATYGPVILKNTSGPNIDQSHAKIQSTNCGQSTGSVTNLVVTGTGDVSYSWTNTQGQVVGTDSILTNQPAGTYKLEVTDATSCGPVYSTAITIPETNGITMDETGALPKAASCGNGNGAVTGIVVTGATQYQWTDANNNVVGNTADLTNVLAGTYTLTASNATGCSKTSKAYTVSEAAATVYPAYNSTTTQTCPRYPTGSISITTDNLVKSLRWVNSQGTAYGSNPQLVSLPADTYTLYLTDVNGCETLYKTFTVSAFEQLAIVAGSEQITQDECNLGKGAVNGVQITGGAEPYVYTWTNENGTVLSTISQLNNVPAGTYKLNVHDASNCGDASASYTVINNNNAIPTPAVSNVQLCSSGGAMLVVNNADPSAAYRLYDSETGSTPADQQTGGKFRVVVNTNSSFYITEVSGSCESSRAELNVTVGLSAVNIANTFTPNGDGINDYWQINNINNYPQALVQIFTRYGQKIFESRGYSIPFDGTYKGQPLPSGVYYYIINLSNNCNLLSGSLTIVR
jgi:gliding motility-associated-like protein